MEPAEPPSAMQQKAFILRNEPNLNHAARRAIVEIVMMGVPGAICPAGLGAVDTDVNLDEVGRVDPDVLLRIYNIVRARVSVLSVPAGGARG